MIVFLFFITLDTLPPLPDLSHLKLPEPPLWIEPTKDSFLVSGYAGDFWGASANFASTHIDLACDYRYTVDWDTVKTGSANASYEFVTPRIWMKPSMHGFRLQRNDTYTLLTPMLDFSMTTPWAVVWGNTRTDVWTINKHQTLEHETQCAIIFDRTPYLPHFEISTIYSDENIKPAVRGKLHIRNVHLSVGTPIGHGFFSPCATIQYLEPRMRISATVMSGTVFTTLRDYFRIDVPIRYRPPVPDESLKVSLAFDVGFDIGNHSLGIATVYKDWNARLVPGAGYRLSYINNVQEVTLEMRARNDIVRNDVGVMHDLRVTYDWSDTAITFVPSYAVIDTLSLRIKWLELSAEATYASERNGLTRRMPSVLLISPIAALRYKSLKLFVKVFNITNRLNEFYDGYELAPRQFAGGAAWTSTF